MIWLRLVRTVAVQDRAYMRPRSSMPSCDQHERVYGSVAMGRMALLAACLLLAAGVGSIPRIAYAIGDTVSNVPAEVTGKQLVKVEARRKTVFRQMLKHPTNMKVALQYAELSTEVGDLEGAISTLDRLVLFAPTLPRLKFDLGSLYFRLGSFQQAKIEFQLLVNSNARISNSLKRKAHQYLVTIQRRGNEGMELRGVKK